MSEQQARNVDDRLPKWLSSKILSAVDFVWQVKGDDERTMKRINVVTQKFSPKEMTWVMMLLTLPKLQTLIMKSEDAMEFIRERNKARTIN
jgi:hypothetical protein